MTGGAIEDPEQVLRATLLSPIDLIIHAPGGPGAARALRRTGRAGYAAALGVSAPGEKPT